MPLNMARLAHHIAQRNLSVEGGIRCISHPANLSVLTGGVPVVKVQRTVVGAAVQAPADPDTIHTFLVIVILPSRPFLRRSSGDLTTFFRVLFLPTANAVSMAR
jgi:hypothetical protein